MALSIYAQQVGRNHLITSRFLEVVQILGASLFIGLCAQIKIPLFFTPIPLTGQTFAVLLIGSLLGSRKGALAALCYLVEGSIGLPVWAGGAAGFLHLMGPTGGYRLAYVLQAYLAGKVIEKGTFLSPFKLGIALWLVCWLQLGLGSLWLAAFVGFQNLSYLGFLPFLPGEALKAFCVTRFLKREQDDRSV